MSHDTLVALFLYAFVSSITPGPNNTLVAALAANGGLRHAAQLICAVPVGWATLLVLCATWGIRTFHRESA